MTNILDEAKFLAGKISQNYKPDKIILFGSVARGNSNSNSDIDLLVIKNSSEKRAFRVKRIFESIRGIKRNYSLDAIVYTASEIEQRLLLGDPFIKNAINEGTLLYG